MLPHRLLPPSSYRSLFRRLFPPCSPDTFPPPFFISLYGLIPSFPRRARYIYRLVSPSGSCLYHTATSPGPACRSPSKTVSPPRFMFPPTQRRIDPFLLSDVYVCAPPLPTSPCTRADLPHTTDAVPARHAVDGLPFGFFRDFFSALLSPSPASSPFLPLTALYRLVTSVSRARDLRASAPGQTIEREVPPAPWDFLDGRR